MIYTCTLNPSLDYYMEFSEELVLGETNRSVLEYYEAGGKGINVSKVLNNLMVPSKAFGFLGGFTKQFFIDLLQKYEYIQPRFTYIDGHTRINLKLKGKKETDLNANGPYITADNFESLIKKLDLVDEGDIFVFSGNVPDYLLENVEDMIKDMAFKGIKVVLDTNPDIIKRCLKYKPFLIRPSLDEIGKILDEEVKYEKIEGLIPYLEKLHDLNASNIIVQLGDQGAIFKCDEGIYYSDVVQSSEVVNTVGTSDSIVAGFIMNSLRTIDIVDCFKFATCCGQATSFTRGLATREKVNELYNIVEIKKIK